MSLPQRIIEIRNPDKTWHEKWYKGRGKINMPHPTRAVLLGPPGSGKSLICKNLILFQNPPFRRIVVIHCDPTFTREYDDLDVEMMGDIPSPESWAGDIKTVVCIEDLEFKGMGKEQARNLDRLFGYVSTHKNISVYLCAQDPFNVPAGVRRCANLWVLWKSTDSDSLATCARRTGMKSKAFREIFDSLMPDLHDSLWIDLSQGSPMKLRKNGFQEINYVEDKQTP